MAKDNWQTPKDLFDKLDHEFNFDVDVACNDKNCLCDCGLTDSLNVLDWAMLPDYPNMIFWMNPPYSRGNIDKFCKKAYDESQKGCTVVGLLPGDCSTKWFHEYVMRADEIRFLKRRVRFIDPDTGKKAGSPTFGNIVVVWRPGAVDAPKVCAYDW
jgi:site-specific DNA-methyltransferase (adenine-specific)